MLAIVEGVKKWEPILTDIQFELLTDHTRLIDLKSQHELSPHWNEMLARFDIDLRYISSVTNLATDALSCYLYIQQCEVDMDPATIASEDLIEVCLIIAVGVDSDIMDAIKAAYSDDKLFDPVLSNPEISSILDPWEINLLQ